jgi:hypothetical protein
MGESLDFGRELERPLAPASVGSDDPLGPFGSMTDIFNHRDNHPVQVDDPIIDLDLQHES